MLVVERKHLLFLKRKSKESKKPYDKEEFTSFASIMEYITNMTTPEEARHALHYLFQGVYDIIHDHNKEEATWALDMIVSKGKKYLHSYYIGEPELKYVKDLLYMAEFLEQFENVYRFKIRGNYDASGGRMSDNAVAGFLRRHIKLIDKYPFDCIVGIASSCFEQAVALSALLDIPIYFIRYSKRRRDTEANFISDDYREKVRNAIKGMNVLITDDYVQSGNSLAKAMTVIQGMGPTKLIGSSVHSMGSAYLNEICTRPNFKIFELK